MKYIGSQFRVTQLGGKLSNFQIFFSIFISLMAAEVGAVTCMRKSVKAFHKAFFVMRTVGRGEGVAVMLCRENGNRKKLGSRSLTFTLRLAFFLFEFFSK